MAQAKSTVTQDIEFCDDGSTEQGERWILWVLSQIPRSVYHGGGDLAPRDSRSAAKNKQDGGGDVSEKKSKTQQRNKKRLGHNRADKSGKSNNDSNDDDDKDINPTNPGKTKREDLQERLRQKLAQHQRDRKADSENGGEKKKFRDSDQARERRKGKSKKDGKNVRRASIEVNDNNKDDIEDSIDGKDTQGKVQSKKKQMSTENSKKRALPSDAFGEGEKVFANGVAETVEFNRVSGLDEGDKGEDKSGRRKKRRKLNEGKLKELQRQLAAASMERDLKEKAGDLHDDNSTGDGATIKDTVKQREIEKALQRAKGERPKDNVAKIRKSIRKEKRKKEKSKEEWAKRVEALKNEKEERQERRNRNLKERKEAKSQGKRPKKGEGKARGKGKPHKGLKHGKKGK